MHNLNESDVEKVCKGLLKAFQGRLAWKWDSRFETVLAEFPADNQDKVRAILESHLNMTWDNSNISEAPDVVGMINSHFGGLRPGQVLFTSNPQQDAFISCAWWPWGGGRTISIRVMPFYGKALDSEKAEQIDLFKSWFGI